MLLTYFDDLRRSALGVPAVIMPGKDAALLARLWKSHGEELVKDLMSDFFTARDPYVESVGYSVGVFLSQASKLLVRRVRRSHYQPEIVDWFEECKRLHGRSCNGREGHRIRMMIDAEKNGSGS